MNTRAQLIPLDGGSPVDLLKDLTLVGRKEECDLRIDHKGVSKVHCVLVKTDGLLLVRDLGSTNGTRVNGQRIRRGALMPNDKLTIANIHYRIRMGPPGQDEKLEVPEHTEQLHVRDLPDFDAKPAAAELVDSGVDQPLLEIKENVLPDVYPEEKE